MCLIELIYVKNLNKRLIKTSKTLELGCKWPVFQSKCSKDAYTEYSLYSGGSGG